MADFYRELGDLFGVALRPHNRWNGALALHVVDDHPLADRVSPPVAVALVERVTQALAEAARPLTRRALRRACRIRASTLGPVLARLLADGRVTRTPEGYGFVSS